jgi:hypothetical protein
MYLTYGDTKDIFDHFRTVVFEKMVTDILSDGKEIPMLPVLLNEDNSLHPVIIPPAIPNPSKTDLIEFTRFLAKKTIQ